MEEKKKRFRPSLTAYRALENEVSQLNEANKLLEKSNKYMEEEAIRLRKENEDLEKDVLDLKKELKNLRNRSFFERLLNK